MPGDLARDADLLAYVPGSASVAPQLRALALQDAAQRLDPDNLRGQTRYAHAMLAAHMLATNPASGLSPHPAVASKKLASLAVTYSVHSAEAGPYAGSTYGLAYWQALNTTPHFPTVA